MRENAVASENMENTRFNLASSAGQPNQRPAAELRTLGGYRLLRRLGEGGMGAVYLAFKEGEEQPVAIKVLNEDLIKTPGFVDRFLREARNGASLNTCHIVRTFDVGTDPVTGKHFLVLEYVDGLSAQALLDQLGHLAAGDALHIVRGIARGLLHAHSRHIIHRDIKPDNILLTRTGVAKLADLGLAKNLEEASHLTATRQGFGTTPYMPYEQAVNARYADERSDIYALGATLYHLLTGVLPFQGAHDLEVIEKKNVGDYTPASFHIPTLPRAIDALLARMLARQPSARFQSVAELIAALDATGLVPERPSFAQGDKPASDSELPTSVNAAIMPTRLNLEIAERPASRPATVDNLWDLRYQTRKGRICNGRATTTQIVQRLKVGRLPPSIQARRQGQEPYHPLSFFAEFKPVLAAAKAARRPLPRPAPIDKALPTLSRHIAVTVIGLLFGLAAGGAALALWLHR